MQQLTALSLRFQGLKVVLVCSRQPRKKKPDYGHYYDDDEEELGKVSSGLAEKLTANGGVLLHPSEPLSTYGLDCTTCSEVTLFGVFAEPERQPTVFKNDIEGCGFGELVYHYVKLNKEDKEIVAAREYFHAPVLPWLEEKRLDGQGKAHLSQTVTFSMEDDFTDAPKPIMTVHIVQKGDLLEVSCMNMAGELMCSLELAADDIVAKLRSSLCEKLQWASMALWDDSEKVLEANSLSRYSLLTAEKTVGGEQVGGCYQCYKSDVYPAGYSASGSSLANMLVLEPGRAGLQYHYKGDYKRAQELRKLVMTDARWSIEAVEDGSHIVRIAGKAKLDRYFCHERSGPEGTPLSGYECFALVTTPVQQLEQVQREFRQYKSTEGCGWTCGSENYMCYFFLPLCLLKALRVKQDAGKDGLALFHHLNINGSADYPYDKMASSRGYRSNAVVRNSDEEMSMIKHLRTRLAGRTEVGMDEIYDELMQLQGNDDASED